MQETNKHDESVAAPRHGESVSPRGTEPSALAALLNEWMQGDATEQRETFEVLRRGLDEGRPAGYKLFS
jgi:hypothetical protein